MDEEEWKDMEKTIKTLEKIMQLKPKECLVGVLKIPEEGTIKGKICRMDEYSIKGELEYPEEGKEEKLEFMLKKETLKPY